MVKNLTKKMNQIRKNNLDDYMTFIKSQGFPEKKGQTVKTFLDKKHLGYENGEYKFFDKDKEITSPEHMDEVMKLEGSGLKDFFGDIKKEYNNVSKKTMSDYGDIPIESMEVVRQSFFNPAQKVLKAITSYDKLYHLSLVCKVKVKNAFKQITIEKQQQVNVRPKVGKDDDSENIDVPLNGKQITINELLNNTLKQIGTHDFFTYDAIKLNCQDFLLALLRCNDLGNDNDRDFIKQDVSHLEDKTALRKGVNFVTDLGARFNQLIGTGKIHVDPRKLTKDELLSKISELSKDEILSILSCDCLS